MANTVTVDIVALTAAFDAQMAKVTKSLAKLESETSKIGNSADGVTKFFKQFASVAVVEQATKAIYNFVTQTAEMANAQTRLAERLGYSAQFVEKLDKAFARSHVDVESAHTAMEKFSRIVGKASAGNIEAQRSLAAVGLNFQQLSKMSPEEQFLAAAAAISKLKNEAQQMEAVTELFGRGSAEMLDFIRMGPEKMRAEIEKSKAMTAKMRADFMDIEKSTLQMKEDLHGLGTEVAAELAPALTGAVSAFVASLKQGRKYVKEMADRMFGVQQGEVPDASDSGEGNPDQILLEKITGKKVNPNPPGFVPPEEAGPKNDLEFNRNQFDIERELKARLKVMEAIKKADARGEVIAKVDSQYKDLLGTTSEILVAKMRQLALDEEDAKATQDLVYAQRQLAATGDHYKELQAQINRQYATASQHLKDQLLLVQKRQEAAQMLKESEQGTPEFKLGEDMRRVKELRDEIAADRAKAVAAGDVKGIRAAEQKEARVEALRQKKKLEFREAKAAQLSGLGVKATPFEELSMQLDKLNSALQRGEITKGQYARATSDIAREKFDLNSPRLSGAQMAGSQEAYKTIVSAMFAPNRDPQLQVAKNTQAMVGILGAINQRMAAQVQQNLNMVN